MTKENGNNVKGGEMADGKILGGKNVKPAKSGAETQYKRKIYKQCDQKCIRK